MITSPEEFKQKLLEIQNEKITFTTLPSSEPRFIINADTREVLIPSEFSFLSVKNDHKAETIYFEIDRYYDNTDLSQHTCVIQFANTGTGGQYNEGINNASELDITTLDGKIVFGWTIGNDATQYSGSLTFSIRFYSISDDRLFSYNFNTTSKTLPILDTLSVIDRDYVIEPSLLSFWEDRMNTLNQNITADINRFNVEMSALSETTKGYRDSAKITYDNVVAKSAEINTTITTGVTSLQNKSNEQVAIIGQKGIDTLATIPEDYTQIDTDVKHLKKEAFLYPARFANALTTVVEGEGQISVTDAWEAPVVNLEIDGASEQVTTTGAQLLDLPDKSGSANGLSYTFKNGVAIVSGTPSVQYAGVYRAPLFLAPGNYYVSGGEYTAGSLFAQVNIAENDDSVKCYANKTFAVTGAEKSIDIVLQTGAYTTPVSCTLRPMLNTGTTAIPWEPYTGGQPSPSPAYQQAIKGVEHVVNSGAQLFDASRIPTKTAGGATVTNNGDGSFTISGSGELTERYNQYIELTRAETLSLFKPGVYALSGIKTNPYCLVKLVDGSKILVELNLLHQNNAQRLFARDMLDNENVVAVLQFYGLSGSTITPGTVKPMLNAGSVALPWEPYNNQQQETDLQFAVTGKNLFNKEDVYSYNVNGVDIVQLDKGMRIYNNTARTYACAAVKVKLKPNTTYTYSCKVADPRTKSAVGIRKSLDNGNTFDPTMISGTGAVTTTQTISRTFTTDEKEYYAVCLFCTYDEEMSGDTTFENIQLEEGSKVTAWEPYYEPQSVTIPLDEPLRGIGDVRDRIAYKDGVWGIERHLKKKTLTSTEKWKTTNSSGINWFYLDDVTDIAFDKDDTSYRWTDKVLSTHFLTMDTPGVPDKGKLSAFYGKSYSGYRLAFRIDAAETIEAFKSFLDTHDVSVYYPISPTWEPFPAETQTALNALTTHPGTTYLTVNSTDVAATVKIEYVQDTQKVIEGLQTAIQALADKLNAASYV